MDEQVQISWNYVLNSLLDALIAYVFDVKLFIVCKDVIPMQVVIVNNHIHMYSFERESYLSQTLENKEVDLKLLIWILLSEG